jgi:hypothetical protein
MLDVQPPAGPDSLIQQFAQQFTTSMAYLLTTIDSTVVDVARLVYITLLVVGILLYYTHVAQRLGKDLIKGGVALAIISEFVFPWLLKV